MRPNFPPQIGQCLATLLHRYWGLLRILVTCNRLFRLAARLGGSRRLTQSYVSKRLILKSIGGAIRRFRMFLSRPRRTMSPHNGRGWVGKPQSSPRLGWNELLIFFQSALILIAARDALRMMGNQARNFRNFATRLFRQYCAGTGDLSVLLACPPAGGWHRRTQPSGRLQSHHLNRDEGRRND
jgi:hypothetical protein